MNLMRRLHWCYAKLCGYFWLPCPLCGEEFGGHETLHSMAVVRRGDTLMGVCPAPACQRIGNAVWSAHVMDELADCGEPFANGVEALAAALMAEVRKP